MARVQRLDYCLSRLLLRGSTSDGRLDERISQFLPKLPTMGSCVLSESAEQEDRGLVGKS